MQIDRCGNWMHVRGDSEDLTVNLTVNGVAHVMGAGDSAMWSVKVNATDTEYVIQKALEGGRLILSAAESASLPAGSYWYDIQLTLATGEVKTYGPKRLTVVQDVTT